VAGVAAGAVTVVGGVVCVMVVVVVVRKVEVEGPGMAPPDLAACWY
jgi:hypothetical protein